MEQADRPSIWTLGIIGRGDKLAELKEAVERGADIHELQDDHYSLLHCAAENGSMVNVRFLLERGADASRKSRGKTPAESARDQGEAEIAELIETFAQNSD